MFVYAPSVLMYWILKPTFNNILTDCLQNVYKFCFIWHPIKNVFIDAWLLFNWILTVLKEWIFRMVELNICYFFIHHNPIDSCTIVSGRGEWYFIPQSTMEFLSRAIFWGRTNGFFIHRGWGKQTKTLLAYLHCLLDIIMFDYHEYLYNHWTIFLEIVGLL